MLTPGEHRNLAGHGFQIGDQRVIIKSVKVTGTVKSLEKKKTKKYKSKPKSRTKSGRVRK